MVVDAGRKPDFEAGTFFVRRPAPVVELAALLRAALVAFMGAVS